MPERIKVFAAPAGGPKWFVSVGLDRALMRSRFLQHDRGRVLLVGSSAGAWRCLTMASRDPAPAHERLRISYSRNVFTQRDTAESIGGALKRNVKEFLRDEDIDSILGHPNFTVAVHSVRAKGPAASERKTVQGGALLTGALYNAIVPGGITAFFERVVFFSGDSEPEFLRCGFRGRSVRLTRENIRAAALATGSLPYIIAGVRYIPGAPDGTYRDGGLVDYQLNQDYMPGDGGVTLFFHYQERIVPGWFDKRIPWRKPPKGSIDRVLQVYPSSAFLDMLPDGRLPDREDFRRYVDAPAERIRRWDVAAEKSEILGTEFLNDVESGAIRRLVKPL
ncbi:MAG: hypothetical protein RDU20_09060 [Desulfomonilaceae bacterium]|nr:hypothetical protein [Desulfomonilaceae bacterium]